MKHGVKSETPREDRVPGNAGQSHRQDCHDPSGQRSCNRSGDRSQGDHFLLARDDEIGSSGEGEFDPAREDVGPHVAGNGLPAFEPDIKRPTMANRGGQSCKPIIKGRGIIAIVPTHIGVQGGETEGRPNCVDWQSRLNHVEDDHEDPDLLAEDAAGVRPPGIVRVVVAGVFMKKDLPDDDSAWDGSEQIAQKKAPGANSDIYPDELFHNFPQTPVYYIGKGAWLSIFRGGIMGLFTDQAPF